MAGTAKPSTVTGSEVTATIISAKGDSGQVGQNGSGLFDGTQPNEWNTNHVFYWGGTGDYLEFSFGQPVNIWRSGTTTWSTYTAPFTIQRWNPDNSSYETVSYPQTVTSINETAWEKTISNLPAGQYKFSYTGLRMDSEWFLEATYVRPAGALDQVLYKITGISDYYGTNTDLNALNNGIITTHTTDSVYLYNAPGDYVEISAAADFNLWHYPATDTYTSQYGYMNPLEIWKWNGTAFVDQGVHTANGSATLAWQKAYSAPLSAGKYRFIATVHSGYVAAEWYLEKASFVPTFLFQDGTSIKKYSGSTWTTLGTAPATDDMYANGMTVFDLATVTKTALALLSTPTPTLIGRTNSSAIKTLTEKFVPNDKLILASGDISMSNATGINTTTLTATTSGSGSAKVIVSIDSGATWYAWVSGAWVTVQPTATDAAAKGMTKATLNALVRANWDVLTGSGNSFTKTIRFGYFLSQATSTDNASFDNLNLNIDMAGSWDAATMGTDYTYGYPGNDTLRVKLLSNGDFKINYEQ